MSLSRVAIKTIFLAFIKEELEYLEDQPLAEVAAAIQALLTSSAATNAETLYAANFILRNSAIPAALQNPLLIDSRVEPNQQTLAKEILLEAIKEALPLLNTKLPPLTAAKPVATATAAEPEPEKAEPAPVNLITENFSLGGSMGDFDIEADAVSATAETAMDRTKRLLKERAQYNKLYAIENWLPLLKVKPVLISLSTAEMTELQQYCHYKNNGYCTAGYKVFSSIFDNAILKPFLQQLAKILESDKEYFVKMSEASLKDALGNHPGKRIDALDIKSDDKTETILLKDRQQQDQQKVSTVTQLLHRMLRSKKFFQQTQTYLQYNFPTMQVAVAPWNKKIDSAKEFRCPFVIKMDTNGKPYVLLTAVISSTAKGITAPEYFNVLPPATPFVTTTIKKIQKFLEQKETTDVLTQFEDGVLDVCIDEKSDNVEVVELNAGHPKRFAELSSQTGVGVLNWETDGDIYLGERTGYIYPLAVIRNCSLIATQTNTTSADSKQSASSATNDSKTAATNPTKQTLKPLSGNPMLDGGTPPTTAPTIAAASTVASTTSAAAAPTPVNPSTPPHPK